MTVTLEQATAVRDAIAATLSPWVTEDNGPTVNMEFDWVGDPHPAVVWEGGPYEWTMYVPHGGIEEEFGFNIQPTELPAGLYVEPATYWALSLWEVT